MSNDPKLTAREIAKLTWLTARMAKRGIAGERVYQGDLEAKFERVLEGARKREEQERKGK